MYAYFGRLCDCVRNYNKFKLIVLDGIYYIAQKDNAHTCVLGTKWSRMSSDTQSIGQHFGTVIYEYDNHISLSALVMLLWILMVT